MNTSELHNTQVNFSGLMELLSKHLYSVPTVAIRELVQNAHDSCSRRRLEDDEVFEPAIRLSTQRSKDILVIEDSGAGLTKEEIIQYITTIGSGYTRVLREKYADDSMIGCFGLGFLTAYAVAKRVELWTTSYQEPDAGWHFISLGAERFHIEPAPARPVGLRIVLHLLRDFSDLTDPTILKRLLFRYCCLLPIPIYVNGEETPVNTLVPP
jgi:molecular chaperone HtpG